jgi:hypothetical protein
MGSTVSAASQRTFITETAKSRAMNAAQQPTQKAPIPSAFESMYDPTAVPFVNFSRLRFPPPFRPARNGDFSRLA